MKKFVVVFLICLAFSANAQADVCYDIDDKAADKAVKIIQGQKEIYKYCSICPDATPETIIVHKAQNKGTVYVNNIAIDVAHVYFKQGNKFINLGVASGCIRADEYDIPAELESLPVIHRAEDDNNEQSQKYRSCADITLPTIKEDITLLSIFSDVEIAEITNACMTQKIENSTTPKQFEYYEMAYENLKNLLQAMLFYKGKLTKQRIALYEMLYMFQNHFYAKIINDPSYEFPLPYQYKTTSEHWDKKRTLEQEILKLSNIEARRQELNDLFLAINAIGNFFYYSGIHNTDVLREKEMDFINMVYNLIMKIKHSEYFMEPNNSTQFFNDCVLWEKMTGKTITEWDTKKTSCPIPFP